MCLIATVLTRADNVMCDHVKSIDREQRQIPNDIKKNEREDGWIMSHVA